MNQAKKKSHYTTQLHAGNPLVSISPSPRYRNRRTQRRDCKDSANKRETRSPTEVTARSRTQKPILKRKDEEDETTTITTKKTNVGARMERWNDDDDEEEKEDATWTMTRSKMMKQILE